MSTPKQSLAFILPATATSSILVSRKSDHSLRKLLYDLFTVSSRMQELRRHLGLRIGVTGPQFSMMMAIAELQGATGVSVGRIADYMHVTGTFITSESAKLAKRKLLKKHLDAHDRRLSLLSLTPSGERLLTGLFPELQQINDVFFELGSRDQFENLCGLLDRLVSNSQRALALVHAANEDSRLVLNDGGLYFDGARTRVNRR
jgi:MarR family transcriptional regulator, organic hydroperoxide resistance regulator